MSDETLFLARLYDGSTGRMHTVHAEKCRSYLGAYFIIVNDDPEHPLGTSVLGLEKVQAEVDEVLLQLADSLGAPYSAAGKNL